MQVSQVKRAISQEQWKQRIVECRNSGIPVKELYLATVPLTSGKAECEIEDLFPDDVLAIQINGKTFSRNDTYDISLHYGKNIFAQYVNSHWQEIDFSGFRPLLNAIQAIISTY